jgi:hypothetical protein
MTLTPLSNNDVELRQDFSYLAKEICDCLAKDVSAINSRSAMNNITMFRKKNINANQRRFICIIAA